MSTLSVHIAAKRYPNGSCAIQGLAFDARAGEFVAIVGPSGAGKTTLLNIISALDTDFEGTLQLGSAGRIGFMFQEPRLMPWLTVAQNLALVDPRATGARLAQALQRVGLEDCAALFPRQLSGGMQRRVALLRAFLMEPNLLLMDEPFQSLDAPTACTRPCRWPTGCCFWHPGPRALCWISQSICHARAAWTRMPCSAWRKRCCRHTRNCCGAGWAALPSLGR
jgi:ABC-type nitrate/sulfonate/bicarbonate transport system ATPase subunit